MEIWREAARRSQPRCGVASRSDRRRSPAAAACAAPDTGARPIAASHKADTELPQRVLIKRIGKRSAFVALAHTPIGRSVFTSLERAAKANPITRLHQPPGTKTIAAAQKFRAAIDPRSPIVSGSRVVGNGVSGSRVARNGGRA